MRRSAIFRAKARAALRHHWQAALLIALIVNLPTLLVQGISSFTNNSLLSRLADLALDASYSTAAAGELPDRIRALLSEPGVLAMAGVFLLVWLVTPVLSLGMNHWLLDRIRGAEEPVSTVFSRLRIFFKSIGLHLAVTLRMLLWMLPGIAVCLLSLLPLRLADGASSEAMLPVAWLSLMILYMGLGGMVVLGVREYLRLVMAEFILADEPEERVSSCIRRSRMMMARQRGAMLFLLLTFFLMDMAVIFVSSFFSGLGGEVVSLLLQMLGSMVVSVYFLASVAGMYETLRTAPKEPVTIPEAPEVP